MKQAWLAIDGGGTKTSASLLSTDGTTLAEAEGSGINRTPRLASRSIELLSHLWDDLCAQISVPIHVTHTYLALAGPKDDWQAIIDHFPHWGEVHCFPDSIAIAALARDASPGIAIHSGTGSFAIAWHDDTDPALFTAGGAGWILGDPGSGVDIGKRTLYALRTQPRSQIQPLLPYLQPILKNPSGQWVHDLYATPHPAAYLASIAPAVLDAAAAGVPLATTIIRDSIEQLATSAWALGSECFGDRSFSVAISGRILTRPLCVRLLKSCFSQYGHCNAWTVLQQPPLAGLQRLLTQTRINHQPLPQIHLFNSL